MNILPRVHFYLWKIQLVSILNKQKYIRQFLGDLGKVPEFFLYSELFSR